MDGTNFNHVGPRPDLDTCAAKRKAIWIGIRMTMAMALFSVMSVLAWTAATGLDDERARADRFTAMRVDGGEFEVSKREESSFALRAGSTTGEGEDHELIAFCQPQAWAAKPCVCSVESVEVGLTHGQFVRYLRERRAAGATSAAELRTAMRHAHDVCGDL
jgi:hypothetical protein